MDPLLVLTLLILTTLAGWTAGRWSLSRKITTLREEGQQSREALMAEQARRESESKAAETRIAELKAFREQVEGTFKGLSAEALQRNNQQFLELAGQTFARLQTAAKGDLEKRQEAIGALVEPLKKSLDTMEGQLRAVEKARTGAYSGLQEQIRQLLESEGKLQRETGNLVMALKAPSVRGRWGEIQLERTVEFAGMTEHVDFIQQASTDSDQGRQRPDLVVHLPGGKRLVVDAKAPLDAYLKALDCDGVEERRTELQRHARQIRDHVKGLSSKQYWKQFEPTPEFVILFLPGEVFFSAALEMDPQLIEYGAEANVLLATPTTLIALLKAAFYGWRQEAIAEEAKEISQLGRDLYERLATQTAHFEDVGKHLGRAVEAYNKSLRSLETRVLVTARKFESLAPESRKHIPDRLEPLEELPREVPPEE
jgi:DNA recombination protein RmuC